MKFSLSYSSILEQEGHPSLLKRNRAIHNLALHKYTGTIKIIPNVEINERIIKYAHTPGYVEEIRKTKLPNGKNIWLGAKTSVECTIASLEDVLNTKRKISFALSSDTGNKAFKSYQWDISYLNQVAIACGYLQEEKDIQKILVIDMDPFHAYGSFDILQERNNVNIICIHSEADTKESTGNEIRGFYDIPTSHTISGSGYINQLKKILDKVSENDYEFVLVDFGFNIFYKEVQGFQIQESAIGEIVEITIRNFIFKNRLKGMVFHLAGGEKETNAVQVFDQVFKRIEKVKEENIDHIV